MLYESFTEPEPHFAQILKADSIAADRGLPEGREPRSERASWTAEQTGVTRTGNKVDVKMMCDPQPVRAGHARGAQSATR